MGEMIISDSPVFAFFAKGNYKKKLSQWRYCHVASYEQAKDVTVCIVKSTHLNRQQRRTSQNKLQQTILNMSIRPMALQYYPSGLDIIEFWKDNCLTN